MGWKCYELKCCLFLDGDDLEYSFGHCFLTLEWDLMSWSKKLLTVMPKIFFGLTTGLVF